MSEGPHPASATTAKKTLTPTMTPRIDRARAVNPGHCFFPLEQGDRRDESDRQEDPSDDQGAGDAGEDETDDCEDKAMSIVFCFGAGPLFISGRLLGCSCKESDVES